MSIDAADTISQLLHHSGEIADHPLPGDPAALSETLKAIQIGPARAWCNGLF